MRPNLHRCSVPGCQADIPRHLLMCIPHWRMVPAPVQREVTTAWRSLQQARRQLVRGQPTQDEILEKFFLYIRACRDAVDEVLAKAARKQAELTEQFGDLFRDTRDTPAAAGDTTHKNDSDGNTTTPLDGQATL